MFVAMYEAQLHQIQNSCRQEKDSCIGDRIFQSIADTFQPIQCRNYHSYMGLDYPHMES